MKHMINFSEGVSLALHSMALMSRDPGGVFTVKDIAEFSGASQNHLSKIMQRLVQSGVLSSTRGPKGGFRIARDPQTISLLDVFESIEGKLPDASCPLSRTVCPFGECMFDDILHSANSRILEHFRTTTLASLGQGART